MEAAYTGTVADASYKYQEERNNFCPDAGTRRYRTFNGTCNHPENLGASFTIQNRLLPAAYSDGVNSPRMFGEDGLPLPSARTVSMKIHVSKQAPATNHTLALMAWGQWLDHDIVSTAVANRPGKRIRCCGPNGSCPPSNSDPNCFPIELPSDEYVFEGSCLEFVRALAATDAKGVQILPRAQMNTVTAFVDASPVYGSTDQAAESLREPGGYLLRMKLDGFPPEAANATCIKRDGSADYCFEAGDFRVNQHPYISALHTLFLRESNRIAKRLRRLKPKLPNEEIYQMTRRVVSATNQHITYNEFLPIVLGSDADVYGLTSTVGRSHYDPGIDPRMTIAFGSAAFRYGHSTIPSYFPMGNKQIQLKLLFSQNGYIIDHFEDTLAGMAGVSNTSDRYIESVDRFISDGVSKFLFFNNITGKGLDLVSINIQRGRDVGLPPYYKWREYCGLRPLTGFDDVEAMGPDVGQLAQVYRSIHDIDLFTGMLHEPVTIGIVGPTIRCILGRQFQRLKHGDRWFFDNNERNTRFTDAQLAALRKVTLGEVMCQNSYLHAVPANVFYSVSETNPLIPCSRLRQFGLNINLFVVLFQDESLDPMLQTQTIWSEHQPLCSLRIVSTSAAIVVVCRVIVDEESIQ
ncbi:hypothetical protein BsWGS_12158 [Bradybaena similaris]